jgi:hypothetical protein
MQHRDKCNKEGVREIYHKSRLITWKRHDEAVHHYVLLHEACEQPPCARHVVAGPGRAKDDPQDTMMYSGLRIRGFMLGEIGYGAPGAPYVKLSLLTVKRAIRSSFGV